MSPRRRRQVPKHFHDAHSLAFAPLLFQAAMSARDMGVLDAVHEAASAGLTPGEVATRANVTIYAARVLLEGCKATGLVALEGGRYRITDTGKLWLFDEMTKVNANFVQDVCYSGAREMETSLRTSAPAGLKVFGSWPTIYEGLTQLPPKAQASWFAFDHFYSDGAFPLAFNRVFARKPKRLLDVGGNTGKWALHCLARDPDVHVTILDHPGQLDRLTAAAEAAGVANRLTTIATDLLDHARSFPDNFDVVWMSQFLDCFGESDIQRLLERGRAALARDGRLMIMETFWDRQENDVAELSLQATSLYFTCMANGTSRMYHSNDFMELITRAGLRVDSDEPCGFTHTLLGCVAS